MKKILVCLLVSMPLMAQASDMGPRKTSVAHCQSKKTGRTFELLISKVLAPKSLCQTKLAIGQDVFRTPCEYAPQGLYYVGPSDRNGHWKVLFATWGIIKAEAGEIDINPDTANEEVFVCKIVGAQG